MSRKIFKMTKEGGELFSEFASDRVREYREPQKVGTPKGYEIGFSRSKYEATIWSLLNAPLRDIAKKLGISYGVLRKWRTEKKFLEVESEQAVALAEMLMRLITERLEREEREFYDTGRYSSSTENEFFISLSPRAFVTVQDFFLGKAKKASAIVIMQSILVMNCMARASGIVDKTGKFIEEAERIRNLAIRELLIRIRDSSDLSKAKETAELLLHVFK